MLYERSRERFQQIFDLIKDLKILLFNIIIYYSGIFLKTYFVSNKVLQWSPTIIHWRVNDSQELERRASNSFDNRSDANWKKSPIDSKRTRTRKKTQSILPLSNSVHTRFCSVVSAPLMCTLRLLQLTVLWKQKHRQFNIFALKNETRNKK